MVYKYSPPSYLTQGIYFSLEHEISSLWSIFSVFFGHYSQSLPSRVIFSCIHSLIILLWWHAHSGFRSVLPCCSSCPDLFFWLYPRHPFVPVVCSSSSVLLHITFLAPSNRLFHKSQKANVQCFSFMFC